MIKLNMSKRTYALSCVVSLLCHMLFSQENGSGVIKEGWIDFNKNGIRDVFEDTTRDKDERVEDLLSQMTLEEKTCQMVTLYGFGRVLMDELPTEGWKKELWK